VDFHDDDRDYYVDDDHGDDADDVDVRRRMDTLNLK